MKKFLEFKKRNLLFYFASVIILGILNNSSTHEKILKSQEVYNIGFNDIINESIVINHIGKEYIVFTFNKGLEEKLFFYYKIDIVDKELNEIKKTFKLFSESKVPQLTTLKCGNLKLNKEYFIRVSIKEFINKNEEVIIEQVFKTNKKDT